MAQHSGAWRSRQRVGWQACCASTQHNAALLGGEHGCCVSAQHACPLPLLPGSPHVGLRVLCTRGVFKASHLFCAAADIRSYPARKVVQSMQARRWAAFCDVAACTALGWMLGCILWARGGSWALPWRCMPHAGSMPLHARAACLPYNMRRPPVPCTAGGRRGAAVPDGQGRVQAAARHHRPVLRGVRTLHRPGWGRPTWGGGGSAAAALDPPGQHGECKSGGVPLCRTWRGLQAARASRSRCSVRRRPSLLPWLAQATTSGWRLTCGWRRCVRL